MFKHLLLVCILGLPACGTASRPQASAARAVDQRAQQEPERLFRLGQQAAERGDSVRAEQYVSLALEHGYPAERGLPLLLQVCLAGSRLRAALDHSAPYLQQHPEHDALRFLVANIHLGLAQDEEALGELELLLKHSPRFEEALFLRAVVLMPSDREAARSGFRDYLDVAPRGSHAAEARSHLSELALREARAGAALSERRAETQP